MDHSDPIDESEEEARYRITVKGFLVLKLGHERGIALWDELVTFAKKQLDYDEVRDGVPAIILRGGGEITSVSISPNEASS